MIPQANLKFLSACPGYGFPPGVIVPDPSDRVIMTDLPSGIYTVVWVNPWVRDVYHNDTLATTIEFSPSDERVNFYDSP